jgi:hypothetical protein
MDYVACKLQLVIKIIKNKKHQTRYHEIGVDTLERFDANGLARHTPICHGRRWITTIETTVPERACQ